RNAADAENTRRAVIDTNYRAWQVINSAQGKGGSGGRIEGLAALLKNGVSLAGVCLDDAWLERVQLPRATLTRASMQRTNLAHANLAAADLEGVNFHGADLLAADLTGVSLKRADLTGARLSAATLDGADLAELTGWTEIASISHASIDGVKRAPDGFIAWAREHGAVDKRTPAPPEDGRPSESREFRAL
ncbi:MAG: pentapeptide repeat-containing protein, partial [Gemmatimonadales bacterium]